MNLTHRSPAAVLKTPSHRLRALWPQARPVVMGIVNCTADSFSDGGRYLDAEAALAHARRLVAEGAEILDVGGESTRPGAQPVPAGEELERVLPVVAALRQEHTRLVISVDTSKAEVAEAALAAGADLINDVTAGADPRMLPVVAGARAGIVLMHMRGSPRTMQLDTGYQHVVAEVHEYLRLRADAACSAGIDPDLVWLDPGIGFGKDDAGNLALLAALPALATLGHPVLVGPSRKSFIGRLTGAPINERLPGTLAALLPACRLEHVAFRVHEVAPVIQFLSIARHLVGAAA